MTENKGDTKTAMSIRVKALESKRKSLLSLVQGLAELSKSVASAEDRRAFLMRTHTIERTQAEYLLVIDHLIEAKLEVNADFTPSHKYIEVLDELMCRILSVKAELAHSEALTMAKDAARPRLPPLALLRFNGEVERWPAFADVFKRVVDSNPALSDAEKVQYLITHLSGVAAVAIMGILPSGDNYSLIWKTLQAKYEDVRSIASAYLGKLLRFKSLPTSDIKNLNKFTDEFVGSVAALKALNLNHLDDFIITHVALSKLPITFVQQFEQSFAEGIPTFGSLSEFVRKQNKILERVDSAAKPSGYNGEREARIPKVHGLNATLKDVAEECGHCKGLHSLVVCKKFLNLSPSERFKIVKNRRLCYICLKGHRRGACTVSARCKTCKGHHHSLLHFPPRIDAVERESESNNIRIPEAAGTALVVATNRSRSGVIVRRAVLPTALVSLRRGPKGDVTSLRVLLDSGASSNFISTRACEKLRLRVRSCDSVVNGLGNVPQPVSGFVDFQLTSRYSSTTRYWVRALVVKELTSSLPSVYISHDFGDLLSEVNLADDGFAEPSEIQCILGAAIFARIMGPRKISLPDSNLFALESTFGYIIMGEAGPASVEPTANCAFISDMDGDLEQCVQRFWKLESVPERKLLSPAEQDCERFFENSLSRLSDGSFLVSLPFMEEPSVLGNSRLIAEKRLLCLERKLGIDSEMRSGYNDTFKEYLDRGFLHKISETVEPLHAYYIPHRAVYRPDKATSKIRLVLDASSKTSSGKSLNDILHCGPNIQSNIFNLLLNFRLFGIALTADIEKMYFSIKVLPEHRRFLRVLYRFEESNPVSVYEFSSLPMGISPACYIAVKVLRRLFSGEDNLDLRRLLENSTCTYMDDYLLSVQSCEEAVEVSKRLTDLHAKAGFKLVKWLSNSKAVMSAVSVVGGSGVLVDLDTEPHSKLVGLWWDPESDSFLYKIGVPDLKACCTKRYMLSVTASLYDPLGFLTPVVAGLKQLIQECWKRNLDWDTEVSLDISTRWLRLVAELGHLSTFTVPRHLGLADGEKASLLGFCDASEACMGAVLYIRLRGLEEGTHYINLVCAKSRLAPIKNVSLARLELCAAVLLSQLIRATLEEMGKRFQPQSVLAFSDSTVALSWICSSPHRWHTFIANRVALIQDVLAPDVWYHVPGKDNPSDLITRPPTPSAFVESPTWLTGPLWAYSPASQWPAIRFSGNQPLQEIPEFKPVILVAQEEPPVPVLDSLINRFSSWTKLLRVLVYVLRFCRILSSSGIICSSDIAEAEKRVVRHVQAQHFAEDISRLRKGKSCSKQVRKLTPFLRDDIVHVGGRLNQAELTFRQRHPVLLPARSRATRLMVEHVHQRYFHTGPGLLLALVRKEYWILSARNLIRNVVHSCNVCFRSRPQPTRPPMGNLPEIRLKEAKSFLHSGVDYAGPVFVKMSPGRKVKLLKAYICLFVCLATKAVHIELVSDLTTNNFLAAFKRFLSRRGPVTVLMSDSGRNFIGAKSRLSELYAFLDSPEVKNELLSELAIHRTEIKTIPPLAPNFGGLWESNVKSVKTHLFRVIGSQTLTYEELNTLLVQIEALLNSRPLCILSGDPNEPLALTPSHFLTFQPLDHFPAEDLSEIPIDRVHRFYLIDGLVQSYWKRWRTEYISALQVKEKWNVPDKPLSVGQVVLVNEPHVAPLIWPLAVITEIFPGKDGVCRVVRVKTRSGEYIRPASRICVLPTQ